MIELDRKYNLQNNGTELDESLLRSLPLPIYDACKLLENQTDYEKSLQVLCLSLIPWTYQYIALILSGEYLESKYEPSFEVTDSLLNMVKKPGPGKWIGFARSVSGYFMDHETTVISHEAIFVLNSILNGKNKPQVKVPDNENRMDYTDALISVRNRFAHSRSFTGDKARELFQDYFQIWKAWIVIIKEIFVPRLLFRSSTGKSFQAYDNRPLDTKRLPLGQDDKVTLLWNDEKSTYIRLYPIIVTYPEDSKTGTDVAFLEEIKNKYLFYLQGDNFFKLKEEFVILSKIIDSKTVKIDIVNAESLTLKTFAERIDRITNQTITDFQDALKYIPEIFLDRPSITDNLDIWIESNLPGCIISGNPGTGKTSLITNWCVKRKSKGDHVLLFEASRLNVSDITGIIEKELNLGSPLKDCLDAIQKQNIRLSEDQPPHKFLIVIDAVNEFTGLKNENRSRLWREINSLISILNLYTPYLKCLVTTRSDLWNIDFPEKNSDYDMLKEKLYWGKTSEGFPRMTLGDLSLDETSEIYEKARKNFPSMAVQTSFDQLSDRTKKTLSNPFLLRLALVTYNGKNIPNLTKSKIEKRYAKERIIEEKDKKTVLFALLERMSQLRKTEVTIDEFLYAEVKVKSKKKTSKKQKKDLERLIYDPRPQSSYKKLIKEGIIEERTEEGSIESKEKIRFPQEKITDIIYTEFQQRLMKRILKMFLVLGIYFLVLIGLILYGAEKANKTFDNKIMTGLSINIHDQVKSDQIYSLSSGLIGKANYTTAKREVFIVLIIYIVLSTMLTVPYTRFMGARMISNDLPSRFIKEKFTEVKQKKIWYGLIPVLLLSFLLFIRYANKYLDSNQSISIEFYKPLIYGMVFLLFFIFIWDVILGCIIVIKNAKSPQDAFCIFGKKEVIQSCFEFIAAIPFLLIVYFGGPHISNIANISTDKELISLRQQWTSSEAIVTLNEQNPDLYSKINIEYLDLINTDKFKVTDTYFSMFSRAITYSLLIGFIIYLILQYFAGFMLYKILK